MTINVRHDDFPHQVEWAVWYYQPVTESSVTPHGEEGKDDPTNSTDSEPLTHHRKLDIPKVDPSPRLQHGGVDALGQTFARHEFTEQILQKASSFSPHDSSANSTSSSVSDNRSGANDEYSSESNSIAVQTDDSDSNKGESNSGDKIVVFDDGASSESSLAAVQSPYIDSAQGRNGSVSNGVSINDDINSDKHDKEKHLDMLKATLAGSHHNDEMSSDQSKESDGDLRQSSNTSTTVNHMHPYHLSHHDGQASGDDPLSDTSHTWRTMFQSRLEDGKANTIEMHYLYGMKPGLYALVIHDAEGDGICCAHRYGWATILGNQTVIWNHNGEFQSAIKVFVRLGKDGNFKVVQTSYDGQVSKAIRSETSLAEFVKEKRRREATTASTTNVPGVIPKRTNAPGEIPEVTPARTHGRP